MIGCFFFGEENSFEYAVHRSKPLSVSINADLLWTRIASHTTSVSVVNKTFHCLLYSLKIDPKNNIFQPSILDSTMPFINQLNVTLEAKKSCLEVKFVCDKLPTLEFMLSKSLI